MISIGINFWAQATHEQTPAPSSGGSPSVTLRDGTLVTLRNGTQVTTR